MSGTSGGWRGADHEAHLYLSPDDDEVVRTAHARAVEAGGVLDAKLNGLKNATSGHGGQLEGLKYSVKGLDSLRRKVASDVARGENAADVVADTRDMNRYTVCFPAESYSAGVAASFGHLKESGLEPYNPSRTHKNTWNDPSYKGINTSWVDTDTGQFVEIQFHTPESFQAKSDNHALYELTRSGALDDDEVAAADRLQADRYAGVEIPPGHDETVPAKPARELKDFPPEALEDVRAKEAELKHSQGGEPAAPREPEPEASRSGDANEVTEAGPAQEVADERPEADEAEDGFPQPVDNEPAVEGRDPDEPDAEETDRSADTGDAQDAEDAGDAGDAADAQEAEDAQDPGASYEDHEDRQLARISASADEQQESGDRDDYGGASFTTENHERGGVGD